MKNKTYRSGQNVFWGVAFIAAAVIILLDALNVGFDIPLFKIVLGIIFAAWLIKEILKKNVTGIFFPIAFGFMVFEEEIARLCGHGEELISNWIVLLAAVLLSAGTHFLLGNGVKASISYTIDDTHKHHSHVFGDAVRYIDCTDFSTASVSNKFGQYDVYFQNTDTYTGDGILEVLNRFGELNIYIPDDWRIDWKLNNSIFSDTKVHGEINENGKVLTITGTSSFGEINIYTK